MHIGNRCTKAAPRAEKFAAEIAEGRRGFSRPDRRLRKARALSLICHTLLPLSEVSLALGYTDESIFSRAFQRWYGESAAGLS